MESKCSNPECVAPISCHEGHEDHTKCEYWQMNNSKKPDAVEKPQTEIKKNNLVWTGESLKISDISQISYRNTPIIIGLVGKPKAGKTTFLAMLYTLLLKGEKFNNYSFAGSQTIIGWDKLYHTLKLLKHDVSFPEPTPSNYLRLLHLALKNNENMLKDIFLSDASGEVFMEWSKNKNHISSDNARWIYQTSNGFILFIDCDDLIVRKNLAKTEIIDIAEMLNNDLKARPVIAVWSKADMKKGINSVIKDSLKNELADIFKNYNEIDISNFPSGNPDPLVHENNLKVIDWLLEKIIIASHNDIVINNYYGHDLFLGYKSI